MSVSDDRDKATEADPDLRHTLFEDVQAVLTGALIVSIGIAMHKQAGLLTGGITGGLLIGVGMLILLASSILGAFMLNLAIATNHRRDRYTAA